MITVHHIGLLVTLNSLVFYTLLPSWCRPFKAVPRYLQPTTCYSRHCHGGTHTHSSLLSHAGSLRLSVTHRSLFHPPRSCLISSPFPAARRRFEATAAATRHSSRDHESRLACLSWLRHLGLVTRSRCVPYLDQGLAMPIIYHLRQSHLR